MLQIVEQTKEEKLAMYMKLPKKQIAEMLINCNDIITALTQAKNCVIPAVVGRSEQLVCEHPDEALIRDKPTEYCMACGMNI